MIEIPSVLQSNDLRFVKVLKGQKRAFEKNWQTTSNYPYNSDNLKKHLELGGNYGVCGGFGNLVIIDCDVEEILKEVEKQLPDTFTVKTTHGKHFYYFCDDLNGPIRLNDEEGKNIGDVQYAGKYVVGPNSIHPSGKKYEVFNDCQITKVSAEEIKFCLRKWVAQKEQTHKEHLKKYNITDELNVRDVIPFFNLKEKGDEYQGPHPIHGSEGGNNFTVNPSKNVWHCFRHDTGGNAFTWIAIEHGLINCSDATHGCLDGDKFLEVLKIAEEKYGYKPPIKNIVGFDTDLDNSEKELREKVMSYLLVPNKNNAQATEIIVNYFEANNHIYTLRSDTKSEIWIYTNGIYKANGGTFVKAFARKILGPLYNQFYANLILTKIESDTYTREEDLFREENKDLVCVENGVLNLNTRELTSHSPDYHFFSKIPIKYNPECKCPTIDKHLRNVLKSEEDLPIIKELFGFLLLREYTPEKSFMFLGNGRNGKGKTLDLMKHFVGPDNCANIPIQQLESDNWSMAELHKKLVNLGGDINATALKDLGNWKSLTGRDLISAPRKFLNRVHFTNYAKMIFCANILPRTYELTDAFFERWILLEFPYTFVNQERLDSADEDEKKFLKLKDPNIVEKLISEEELSGLLNDALTGLERLRKNKGFSYSKSTEDVKTMWIAKSDSFMAFCKKFVIESYDDWEPKAELQSCYLSWCKKNKLRPVSLREIKRDLENEYFAWEDRITENKIYVWKGIKLVNKEVS